MHKIKEKLMEELHEYETKMKKSGASVSAGDLETLHKLTDTIKNIDKIEMLEDGEYSEAEGMYGNSYEGGISYARGGGRGRGRNARRDSMGRYSRDDGMSYADGGSSYARGGYSREGYSREGYGRGGGYSRDDGKEQLMMMLGEAMQEADDRQRRVLRKAMNDLESI